MDLASDFDKYQAPSAASSAGTLASDFDEVATPVDSSVVDNFGTGYAHGIKGSFNNALQGVYDLASRWTDRIAGSRLGNAAQSVSDYFGLKPAETLAAEKGAEIAAQNAQDAPALATTSGKVGDFLGQSTALAPAALMPGANTMIGAPLVGALGGYLTSAGSPDQRLLAARNGAIGGGAGLLLGQGLSKGAKMLEDAGTVNPNALLKEDNLSLARKYGYVLPPQEVSPGPLNAALEGLSGKIKTSQAASQANQIVTNKIVGQALGIPEGLPITSTALREIRKNAGQAYEAIRGAGQIPVGQTFNDALDAMVKKYSGAEGSFPGYAKPDVETLANSFRVPSFDSSDAISAIRTLREDADGFFRSGNTAMAKTSKGIADNLEQAIDDHLSASNAPTDLVNDFRGARQTIAKTYSVEKALNPVTGNVDAAKLAAQLKNGKPLDGTLKDVATVASAFPKATQALKQDVNPMSPLDWATGALGFAFSHPLVATGALLRPVVRGAILSRPAQALNYATRNSDITGNLLLPALQSTPVKNLIQLEGMQQGIRSAQ